MKFFTWYEKYRQAEYRKLTQFPLAKKEILDETYIYKYEVETTYGSEISSLIARASKYFWLKPFKE